MYKNVSHNEIVIGYLTIRRLYFIIIQKTEKLSRHIKR